jgi:hypothetical protein
MRALKAAGFKWPWKREEMWPRLCFYGCGLFLGALVTAAAHSQMSGAWPAFIIGAGAPATIRGLLSGVEVDIKLPADLPEVLEPKPANEEGISETAG